MQHKALFLLPEVPEDARPAVKAALEARNVATMSGVCPICGARRSRRDRRALARAKPGRVIHSTLWHEIDCPAPDPWRAA